LRSALSPPFKAPGERRVGEGKPGLDQPLARQPAFGMIAQRRCQLLPQRHKIEMQVCLDRCPSHDRNPVDRRYGGKIGRGDERRRPGDPLQAARCKPLIDDDQISPLEGPRHLMPNQIVRADPDFRFAPALIQIGAARCRRAPLANLVGIRFCGASLRDCL
jgi:hypothetical protein